MFNFYLFHICHCAAFPSDFVRQNKCFMTTEKYCEISILSKWQWIWIMWYNISCFWHWTSPQPVDSEPLGSFPVSCTTANTISPQRHQRSNSMNRIKLHENQGLNSSGRMNAPRNWGAADKAKKRRGNLYIYINAYFVCDVADEF